MTTPTAKPEHTTTYAIAREKTATTTITTTAAMFRPGGSGTVSCGSVSSCYSHASASEWPKPVRRDDRLTSQTCRATISLRSSWSTARATKASTKTKTSTRTKASTSNQCTVNSKTSVSLNNTVPQWTTAINSTEFFVLLKTSYLLSFLHYSPHIKHQN